MKQTLPTRTLPANPDLAQLRRQAKELLAERRAAGHPDFALHEAQFELARSYGFGSWPKLKAFVDGVTVGRVIEAVRANAVEDARRLLRARPELVNMVEPGKNGQSALHYAVTGRMPEMARMLMEFEANPFQGLSPHVDATRPLTIAIERGYDDIAAILREPRPHKPAVEEESLTQLQRAYRAGDENEIVALLARHPELARVPYVEQLCGTAQSEAAIAMLARIFPGRRDELSARAAIRQGDTAGLRAVLAGADLRTPQDEEGWLLRVAVDADQPEIMTMLLDAGFDPDARVRVDGIDEVTFSWGMPLYQCARSGRHDMARLLLERGADANGQVYAGGTPLSEAYGQRDEAMIELLERFGGTPNPSMAGLYRRKDLAVTFLAQRGDEELPDDGFGSGPVAAQLLYAAARGGDAEIAAMALARIHWEPGDKRWYGALTAPLGFWNHWYGPWCHQEWDRTTYLACFRMVLARMDSPNLPLRYGVTVLHQVVTMGSHVTAEEQRLFAVALLDAGARLDQRDDLLRSTPLGWACRWGHEHLVRLFLARGADPIEADAEPWARPLAWAQQKGHAQIAALLAA